MSQVDNKLQKLCKETISEVMSFLDTELFIPDNKDRIYSTIEKGIDGFVVRHFDFTITCVFKTDNEYTFWFDEDGYKFLERHVNWCVERADGINGDIGIIKETIKALMVESKSSAICQACGDIFDMLQPYFPQDIPQFPDHTRIKNLQGQREMVEHFGDLTLHLCLTNTNKGTIKLVHNKILSDKKQELTTIHESTFKPHGVFHPFTNSEKTVLEDLLISDLEASNLLPELKTEERDNGS